MLTLEIFKTHWEKKFPAISLYNTHFLIAISGGIDSVVLTYLMHLVGAKYTLAHANFQLRGEESTRDEKFVTDYANRLHAPMKSSKFETAAYAETYKMGIQQAAREIRYAWFDRLLKEIKAQGNQHVYLLTAHHADDQVETTLMQLFRGTGLHGLTGIPEQRNDVLPILRPLLPYSKTEIHQFAKEYSLTYVEDSSNEKNDYTRNLIRNKLIPSMKEVFPQVVENVLDTIQRLKEAEMIVEASVDEFWKKGIKIKKGIPTISIPHWKKVRNNHTYTWGLIEKYNFKPTQIQEVYKLLEANNGAYLASATHRFIKFNDAIQLVTNDSEKEHLMIPIGEGILKTKYGKLQMETIEVNTMGAIDASSSIAYLDADALEFPLLIRSWQITDYFYPLGLRKKKKLSHFLGSLKLSPVVKERVNVLTMGDKILWVVGQRIDDRFKVTEKTKWVLKITYQDTL
jgi:tRNA(Ile)-lysidine synthase